MAGWGIGGEITTDMGPYRVGGTEVDFGPLPSSEQKSSLSATLKSGERMNPHGKPPFGFRWSGDVLEPDEREQLAIAAIEDYRDQGWTLRKIAIALNGAG